MELPITATGRTGVVMFDGHIVSITRPGMLARLTVGKGEKRIPVGQVTAIQLKPAGPVANGFIQFTIGGGTERRCQFGRQTKDAMKDENSVVFWGRQQAEFEALRDAIQAAQSRPAPVAAGGVDVAGQLAQLGQMYQQGMLSPEEFAAAKARLLG